MVPQPEADRVRPRVYRTRMWSWLLVVGCVLFLWGLIHQKGRTPGAVADPDPSPTESHTGGRELRTSADADSSETASSDRSPLADREQASDLVAARPHQVGYRRMEFRFANPAGEQQTRQLDLWYPTEEQEKRHDYRGQFGRAAQGAAVAPGPHPLVVFSHGYLGASDQSIFLTESCARAGYILAAMNHTDALLNRRTRRMEPPRFEDFANWTDDKYRDRKDDVVALLNQMLEWNGQSDSPWEKRITTEAIGGMGHSLGGYTLLGMAGGWESWTEPRLRAVVLLSPFAQPYGERGDLANVSIPVMLQGGTFDIGITPFLPKVYELLNCPKCYLVLKNENHFGWTNLATLGKTTTAAAAQGNPELMVKYTIDFFDQHLLGSSPSNALDSTDPRLESIQTQDRGPVTP
jgi:predicted dienelactone hydrolase